jgi:NADH-quinone oxidoreductase subunit K
MENVLINIGLGHYLAVSTVVFAFGCAVIMMRRNLIAVLMGIELIMNAAALNFVAFDRYVRQGTDGQIVAIFIIVAAAAEAAVALALALNFFNRFDSIHVDRGAELKQ